MNIEEIPIIEKWEDIPDYEGLYKISNTGKVKNRKDKLLKLWIDRPGYCTCKLYNKDIIPKTYNVHRFVGIVFVPNPKNLPQINHEDCDKTNNMFTNLKWVTNGENQLHAVANGIAYRVSGKDHHRSKPLTQFSLLGEPIKDWESSNQIEKQLGYYSTNIRLCCEGKLKKSYGYIWKYK